MIEELVAVVVVAGVAPDDVVPEVVELVVVELELDVVLAAVRVFVVFERVVVVDAVLVALV